MARLIDATRIEQFILNNCSDNEEINTIYGELINAPTIDLIRCRECKWCEKMEGVLWCNIWHDDTNGLNFCSYAERRADEINDRLLDNM